MAPPLSSQVVRRASSKGRPSAPFEGPPSVLRVGYELAMSRRTDQVRPSILVREPGQNGGRRMHNPIWGARESVHGGGCIVVCVARLLREAPLSVRPDSRALLTVPRRSLQR